MSTLTTFIHRFIPYAFKDTINIRINRSYGRFRLFLFLLMVAIAVLPVMITAGLGYYNYKDLLQKEEQGQLESRLTGSINVIEAMIKNLKTVVVFVARNDRYSELTTDNNLKELFGRLKRQYGFFADLGVIDQTGIQRAYVGPYGLQGTDYSGDEWFKGLTTDGVYISRVYPGYREVPHFAIAVSNQPAPPQNSWILRATIDAATLQHFVNTIKTNASDDLFLIDEEGRLQTSSKIYSQTFSPPLPNQPHIMQKGFSQSGDNILYGVGKIQNSPWSLVLVEKHYIHHQDWTTFRTKLIGIVIFCLVLILLVVYGLVTLLTNLIHKADQMQLTMLREAEHTDKLVSIGRLAAGVGHEINNPLAIINQKTGLVEDLLLMSPDFEHKETIDSSLKVIHHSVERCKAITHRLLGFARRADVHAEEVQVNSIIKEVLTFLENSMMHNRIKMNLQLQDDLPMITSDHLQLQQVFLNITNNAIDAVGKDGAISIKSSQEDDRVVVVIKDNGPGIGKDILPHIFEPFFTTKETGKGTGLGLSITYGLVKKLGGTISVQSQLGQGTAFTITLPQHGEKK